MKKVFNILKNVYLFNLYTDLATNVFGLKGEQPLVLDNDVHW